MRTRFTAVVDTFPESEADCMGLYLTFKVPPGTECFDQLYEVWTELLDDFTAVMQFKMTETLKYHGIQATMVDDLEPSRESSS